MKLLKTFLIVIFFLISSSYVHSQNRSLGHAASNGNLKKVKNLIANGADINSMEYGKWTPLTVALKYRQYEVAKYLIEQGADVNLECGEKWTPLTIAARYGLREMVEFLLENGADVDKVDGFDHSPMYYAVKINNQDIITLLENKEKFDIDFSFFNNYRA